MQICPLRRAWIDAESTKSATRRMQCAAPTLPTNPGSRAERGPRVARSLASLIGWRALANLLDAIPDSNDDFGLF
jgi:hypothetical protein